MDIFCLEQNLGYKSIINPIFYKKIYPEYILRFFFEKKTEEKTLTKTQPPAKRVPGTRTLNLQVNSEVMQMAFSHFTAKAPRRTCLSNQPDEAWGVLKGRLGEFPCWTSQVFLLVRLVLIVVSFLFFWGWLFV